MKQPQGYRLSTPLWIVLVAACALLRIYYCFQTPLYTTDVLRNLCFGEAFWQFGFAVYDVTSFDLSPMPAQFLWHNYHYTYPAYTILFYAALSAVWNAVFFAKMVFTLLDAVSAWMIYRMTGDRWTAALYWLNPVSVWYSSYEGQFEALVVFWMLLSLWTLQKKKPYAFAFLGIAVQTKMFPIFLVPYFLTKMAWKAPRILLQQIGWGLLSGVPSLIAVCYGSYVLRSFNAKYMSVANPISWLIGDPSLYAYYPYWLVLSHFIAGVVFLAFCLYAVKKTGDVTGFIPAMAFTVFAKSNVIGQLWYFVLLPAFCLSIKDGAYRRTAIALAWLFAVHELHSIFIGAIGYQNPADAIYLLQKYFWGF